LSAATLLVKILAIGHDLKIDSIVCTSLEVFELMLYRCGCKNVPRRKMQFLRNDLILYYEILYDYSMIALFVVLRFLAAPCRAVVLTHCHDYQQSV